MQDLADFINIANGIRAKTALLDCLTQASIYTCCRQGIATKHILLVDQGHEYLEENFKEKNETRSQHQQRSSNLRSDGKTIVGIFFAKHLLAVQNKLAGHMKMTHADRSGHRAIGTGRVRGGQLTRAAKSSQSYWLWSGFMAVVFQRKGTHKC